jgi:hypothetical protein
LKILDAALLVKKFTFSLIGAPIMTIVRRRHQKPKTLTMLGKPKGSCENSVGFWGAKSFLQPEIPHSEPLNAQWCALSEVM